MCFSPYSISYTLRQNTHTHTYMVCRQSDVIIIIIHICVFDIAQNATRLHATSFCCVQQTHEKSDWIRLRERARLVFIYLYMYVCMCTSKA